MPMLVYPSAYSSQSKKNMIFKFTIFKHDIPDEQRF
jgi:hypothetical protein